MSRKLYSPEEIIRKRYEVLPWEGQWEEAFGRPAIGEMWFITGASASGKSSFVMQLARELCNYGKVLYLSLEEGVSQSFKERIERYQMSEVSRAFAVATSDSYEELIERLSKQRSARFIIIDSFQYAGWTYAQALALTERYPKKTFIFISQEDKGAPLGKPAIRLRYAAGVKVRVSGFKAFCQGRYSGKTGSYYPVWEEGILRLEGGENDDTE